MRSKKRSNHTSRHLSVPPTNKRSGLPRHSSLATLDNEIETIFREACERITPLLKEKLLTPMKFTTVDGVECDTAKDSLLDNSFAALEAVAAYLTPGGDFYIRAVSPLNDGIIAFEKSEIAAIAHLLAYRFRRPFPTFADLVAFAGEHSRDHSIGEVAWLSLDDYTKQWPEWLKVLVNDPEQQELGSRKALRLRRRRLS